MFCPNCSRELREGGSFCDGCGKKINTQIIVEEEEVDTALLEDDSIESKLNDIRNLLRKQRGYLGAISFYQAFYFALAVISLVVGIIIGLSTAAR